MLRERLRYQNIYFLNIYYILETGMSKIILNRPHKMNSIGKQILADLGECIDHVSGKSKR